MGNITTMFVFVWTLNILIFLSQMAIMEIAPTDTNQFYNSNGTVLEQYSAGGSVLIPSAQDVGEELNPASSENAEENTGIFFLDIMSSVKTWIQDKINYITAIVLGPYNIINSIPGLPKQFVGAISLLWYAISIILLLAFIFGRDV